MTERGAVYLVLEFRHGMAKKGLQERGDCDDAELLLSEMEQELRVNPQAVEWLLSELQESIFATARAR